MPKWMIVLAVLVTAVSVASADSIVSTVPANGFQYYQFDSAGGIATFDILAAFVDVGGPNGVSQLDSMLTLAIDDGSPLGALTGTIVGFNDDESISTRDSYLSLPLAAGSYVLAVGAFNTSAGEFRSGVASSPSVAGDFQLTYTGVENFRSFSSVPEPVALLLFGIAGAFIALRRRRVRTAL